MSILVIAIGTCLGILAAVGLIYTAEYLKDKFIED